MFATAVRDWVTVLGTLGVGGVLGTVATLWFSARQQHRHWVNDNKKLEWRELIDRLENSMIRMASHFPQAKISDDSTMWQDAAYSGFTVVRDRIFIAGVIKKRGIVTKWEELAKYVTALDNPREPGQQGNLPTITGYNIKVIELQDLLIKIAREDLGID